MARFCTNCGKELNAEEAFCSECGTQIPKETSHPTEAPTVEPKVPAEEPPTTTPKAPTDGQPKQEPTVITTPPPVPAYTPPAMTQDPESAVVGTGMFFGLQLLFALPLIGWLICLIMTFAPKNKNLKHYARAALIWILIGLLLSVALFFIGKWVGSLAMEYLDQNYGGLFSGLGGLGGIGDLVEQLGGLEGIGNLAEQFGDLGDLGELTEQFGDLGALVGENGVESGDLAGILEQLPEGALEELLEDLPQQ